MKFGLRLPMEANHEIHWYCTKEKKRKEKQTNKWKLIKE
jgi:hypothetical protein